MWDRVNQYLEDIKFPQKCGKGDFIPEQYVYLLAMKTKSDIAISFQEWLAFDVVPNVRKHGAYLTDEQVVCSVMLFVNVHHNEKHNYQISPGRNEV